MPINNNFIAQGTYTNNSNLSNILLNENVRTSSLITYNLIELIKNNYKGTDAVLDLEQTDEYINNCFKVSLENYMRQIIMDKFPYKPIGSNYTYQYLMFDGVQPNDSIIVGSNKIDFKAIQNDYRLNNRFSENINYPLFNNTDSDLESNLNNRTIYLKHKIFQTNANINYGATDSMYSNGYDKSFKIATFNCNEKGHVYETYIKSSTYTPPAKEDCIKILYEGNASLSYDSKVYGVLRDDVIQNYTTLLITVKDRDGNKTSHLVSTRDLKRLSSDSSSYMYDLSIPFATSCDCLFISARYSNGVRYYDFYSAFYWPWGDPTQLSTSDVFATLVRVVGLVFGHEKQDILSEF